LKKKEEKNKQERKKRKNKGKKRGKKRRKKKGLCNSFPLISGIFQLGLQFLCFLILLW